MVTADLHTHTAFSADSETSVPTMCAAALAAALDTLAITDHFDSDVPKFQFDIPAYRAAIGKAREAFPSLRILRGIEAGFARGYTALLRDAVGQVDPDFLLLSCHSANGIDPYFAERYFTGRTRKEGFRVYLEALLLAMEEIPDFDSLAHIGYVGRYAPPGVAATPLVYADAPDLIDEILTRLIGGSHALEINTSQTAKGGAPIPDADILERYFALGGRLITLGSDAHRGAALAQSFADTAAMLQRIGFTHYAVYERRTLSLRSL